MGHADSTVEQLLRASGFHASAVWWDAALDRFDESAARSLWVRGGRRMGKTVHALRWALRQALERSWSIDPGDVGIIPIVSARRGQALDRIYRGPQDD